MAKMRLVGGIFALAGLGLAVGCSSKIAGGAPDGGAADAAGTGTSGSSGSAGDNGGGGATGTAGSAGGATGTAGAGGTSVVGTATAIPLGGLCFLTHQDHWLMPDGKQLVAQCDSKLGTLPIDGKPFVAMVPDPAIIVSLDKDHLVYMDAQHLLSVPTS